MKQTRRTKREIENMTHECTMYLLNHRLDPHKAFEAMVKDYLMSGETIPYFIKDIKDFIKVSEQLKVKMGKKESVKSDKENPLDTIKLITLDQYKEHIKPLFKSIESKELKISLIHLMDSIIAKDFSSQMLTQSDIRNIDSVLDSIQFNHETSDKVTA